MRQWTPEQRQCIEARGGTLLVSAAAGSGKTSVLVQRVVRLITDPDRAVDVDRLLVVTFTKAAAAEMKQRLSAELSRLLAERPEDRRLQRQLMLLPRANISTVHGFCSTLLRENFHLLDLSPQFKVAEEAETQLLREEAAGEILEECYGEKASAFTELAALLGSGRDDRGLVAAVLRIADFIQSHPFPDEWLAAQEAAYAADGPLGDTLWGQLVRGRVLDTLRYGAALLDKAAALADSEARMAAAYGPSLHADRQALADLCRALPHMGWDETADALAAFSFSGFGRLLKYDDPALKKRVTDLRDEVKKRIAALLPMLCGTEAECRADLEALRPLVGALCAVVRRYEERYAAKKAARRLVDFHDLEHGALRLLVRRDEAGGLTRTPLAEELAARFDEVLVDEYQDTNAAQDALFSALSREESNLFLVGDVKQSIYGFRQAMPAIFIRRRDAWPDFDGQHFPATITLGNNFRSRTEVTDSVNFVFRQLMTREAGGMDYDQREELVPSASYPAGEGYETELLLLDGGSVAEDDTTDAAEARLIAGRIYQLLDTLPITENGAPRPARFGDFCILLRSKAAHAQAYVDELARCGIPAWTAASGGFFSSPEVSMAVSLLRFIDNPLQDVPLLAVLLSPAFGFTPDDCARIRMADKASPLYVAVRGMAHGDTPGLSARCAAFLEQMDRYRLLAASLPVDQLIHRLYEDADLLAVAAARRHGEQRVANLRLLHAYARQFEQGGFRGLSAFVRSLDRMEEQKMDMAPASTLSGGGNVVRILSIHNSKGLEFPVVFLAGLGGLFNPDSTRGDLLLHADAGIGLTRREPDTLKQYNTLSRQGVALAIQNSERAEELRVLYVAMTRAKEKLCLTMTLRQPERTLASLAATAGEEDTLPPFTVQTARSMSEWLLACALRHPSGGLLRSLAGDDGVPVRPADKPWRIEVCRAAPPPEESEAAPARPAPDEELAQQLAQRLPYVYPYTALARVPAKLAASELSRRGEEAFAVARPFVARTRPAFLSQTGLSPAERGTALHTFMQFADFGCAAAAPEEEIARLTARGFLTAEQAASLPLDKIRRFFASELYARMQASPRCLREQPFTITLPATRFLEPGAALPADAGEESPVVQGIADCVFEEEGALIIVDYKTDHVSAGGELAARYGEQLRIYAYALERTLDAPVRECLLYAFALDDVIPVEIR